MLRAENIHIRAVEPEDFEAVFTAENDEKLWHLGVLKQPISAHTIRAYLRNAHMPIQESGQARFAICKPNEELVGLIDLYDFDERNQRAAVGILIFEEFRGKGFAKEAIERLKTYAKQHLLLHQLHCNVHVENKKSVMLFAQCNFKKVGTMRHWERTPQGFVDVEMMQCLL